MIDGQGMTELAYAGLAVAGDWGGVAELRLDLLLRLLLAAVLGGAIGVEREISSKPHTLFAESGSKSSVHPTTSYHCATCRTG